jgi:hypothetical protein
MMRPLAMVLGIAVAAATATAQTQPPPPPPPTALPWQHDWKSACGKAAAEKKPILVVVMKDQEPACPRMLNDLFGDAEIDLKLASFVLVPCCVTAHGPPGSDPKAQSCPRFPGIRCSDHLEIEKELHPRFADAVSGEIIVPQHVVCDATGNVLLRHPWEMKRAAFLEFLANGLELWKGPPAAAKGARSAAVEKLVDAILQTKGDEAREQATRDLLSDASPERESALLDVVARLKAQNDKRVVIRAAGRPELKSFSKTIAQLLDEKDATLRDCAVVTLEEMRDPAVAGALLAAWEKEKDAETRKDLLRALGPCGGGNPEARKLLLAELGDAKENLRAAAACSLGCFLKGDAEVATALESRWTKEKGAAARVAILWGIGESEDQAQTAFVDRLVRNEKGDDLQKLAEIVRKRLSVGLDAMTFGHGKGHRAEVHHLLLPFVAEDRIKRNYVLDLDKTNLTK